MSENGVVDLGFKRLLAHFASRAAGCQYCEAHSLIAAKIHGISDEKVAAVWEYQVSPLYNDAERVALDYALAAGSVPNGVDETLMERMRQHWNDDEIVETMRSLAANGAFCRTIPAGTCASRI